MRMRFSVHTVGLDEDQLMAMAKTKAPIDRFGIGTSLTTSSDAPALDCAYKLQEYAGSSGCFPLLFRTAFRLPTINVKPSKRLEFPCGKAASVIAPAIAPARVAPETVCLVHGHCGGRKSAANVGPNVVLV
jgi:hypothetical protein